MTSIADALTDARNRLQAARIRIGDFSARTELDGIEGDLDRIAQLTRQELTDRLGNLRQEISVAADKHQLVGTAIGQLEIALATASYKDDLGTDKVVEAELVEQVLETLRGYSS